MNQNIEKIKVKNGYSLPFMESFTTIQGEGFILDIQHIFCE